MSQNLPANDAVTSNGAKAF